MGVTRGYVLSGGMSSLLLLFPKRPTFQRLGYLESRIWPRNHYENKRKFRNQSCYPSRNTCLLFFPAKCSTVPLRDGFSFCCFAFWLASFFPSRSSRPDWNGLGWSNRVFIVAGCGLRENEECSWCSFCVVSCSDFFILQWTAMDAYDNVMCLNAWWTHHTKIPRQQPRPKNEQTRENKLLAAVCFHSLVFLRCKRKSS